MSIKNQIEALGFTVIELLDGGVCAEKGATRIIKPNVTKLLHFLKHFYNADT